MKNGTLNPFFKTRHKIIAQIPGNNIRFSIKVSLKEILTKHNHIYLQESCINVFNVFRCVQYKTADVLERAAPLPADMRADIEDYADSMEFSIILISENCVSMT